MYARRLTKEELMENGITEVTTDGHVFKGTEEEIPNVTNGGYFVHDIYDKDENGSRIKIMKKNSAFGYVYKLRTIGLHRMMWAWHYGEVPEGMVVDHINNCHDTIEDYDLSNLQLLTPAENLAKDRDNWHTRELKCKLNKPRSFYEDKLKKFTTAYEQAKKDKDANATHKFRASISQTKARLRYWDNHIEDYKNNPIKNNLVEKSSHECHVRAAKRRELQANIDRARLIYLQVKEAYGPDDDYVKKMWGEWKLAIAELHGFKEECKKAKGK